MAETVAIIAAHTGLQVLLVCASNAGADRMAREVHRWGVSVVRHYAKSRKEAESVIDELALDRIVQRGEDSAKDVLTNTSVVVTTCVAAYDPPVNEFDYDFVIIEETDNAKEQECLIPITLCKLKSGRIVMLSENGEGDGMIARLISQGMV